MGAACGLDRHRRRDSFVLDHGEVPPNRSFGVELELVRHSVREAGLQILADELCLLGLSCKALGYTKQTTEFWKLVPDRSVSGDVSDLAFEVVSPVLKGAGGMQDLAVALQVLNLVDVSVNESTGFHVHVDATDLDVQAVQKVCMNFVQFEAVLDLLIPKARRGGANIFCQSNRAPFGSKNTKTIHKEIQNCASYAELVHCVNPRQGPDDDNGTEVSKYYKLNITPLLRQGGPWTLEFRMQGGTSSFFEAEFWILLVLAFVNNSVRQAWPNVFDLSVRSRDEGLLLMFEQVIHNDRLFDRCLHRIEELAVLEP